MAEEKRKGTYGESLSFQTNKLRNNREQIIRGQKGKENMTRPPTIRRIRGGVGRETNDPISYFNSNGMTVERHRTLFGHG